MNLPNTRKALAIFDAGKEDREALFRAIKKDTGYEIWRTAEIEAVRKVQEAFFSDEENPNPLDKCYLVSIKTLRAWSEGKPTPYEHGD